MGPQVAQGPTAAAAPIDYAPVLGYWKEKLASPPSLALPTDYPRHSGQVIEAEVSRSISNEVCTAVLKYSLLNDYRPYTMVLAAWAILLHKYTREEDMLVGSSTNDYNPLVLRLQLDGQTALKDVVARVRQVELEAETNDVPFDLLLSNLYPRTNEDKVAAFSAQSLFQVRCFNAVDVKKETLDAIAACDWTMFVEQEPDSKRLLPLKLRVTYNTVLFTQERIFEMLAQIEEVLRVVSTQPDSNVSDVSLFLPNTPGGQQLPSPHTKLDDKWEGSIMDHFARWAAKDPERVAVVHKDKKYTYGYLNELSNRLANYLIAKGVQPEDVVTLYAHRSTALVVGILGILKAGATFSVIDPAYPVDRQTIYLSVAQPKAIVQLQLAGALHADVQKYIDENLKIVCQLSNLSVDALGDLADSPTHNPDVKVGPDSVGTLSFTSGSTGIPKGVRGRHISLTHFYPWMSQRFGLGETDRFTMLSGIAHDPIQRDVFTPLFLGACIYVPDAEDIMNPGQLASWIAQYGVTVSHLTPAMGQLLTANATTQMPTLRLVFLVGDILTRRDVIRLQNLAANVTVINMYGTTETQRAVSYFEIKNDNSIHNRKEILPAGWGMKDVQLLILTEANTMAGIGELGEIYVRSPHLSKGYLGLPEATAQKFIVNPFSNDPTDRMYRTGDLGRYMPDGIVECVGRADDQVKIRGFRIELGEIDTFLGQHEDVRENVTMVKRDANEEKQIISYFVPMRSDYSIESMRTWLKSKLPIYSIPSVFVPLTRMPLTPNGKIDKNKLPYPDAAVINQQFVSKKEVDPSRLTPLHRDVMGIWAQVLGREVGIDDNFFDVGGHSISATRVTFELRQKLRTEFPLNMLYRYPTIDQLVERIKLAEVDPTAGFEEEENEDSKEAKLDLEKEIVLDDSITAQGLEPFDATQQPEGVLLTGATGFLGAFLLSSLLSKYPSATVYCLVRAKTNEDATKRVVDNMQAHLLWAQQYESRVVGIMGDLSVAQCGVDDATWGDLAAKTSVIVHNGAWVHWVYPYAKLRPMNVQSTIELLRLAATKRVKSFHFVSSTAVFESSHYINLNAPVKETDDLVAGNGIPTGYGQSKWVSERIIMLASTRGIPTTIFRPGYITGDTKTGVTNVDDYLVRLLKGCVEMNKAPNMINRVNMCPVNFVADAIVHISARASAFGKSFHFINPHVFRFSDYFNLLAKYGYDVTVTEYVEWRDALEALTMTSKDNALYPLLHFVLDDLPMKSRTATLDATQLFKELADSTIRCPPIEDVMGTYLAYLVHTSYLPKPVKAGDDVMPLPVLNLGKDVKLVKRTGT